MSATQTSHQTAKPLDISQIYEMVRANAFPSLWLWGLVAVLCLVDVAAICINPRLFFDFKPIIGAILPLSFGPVLIWRLSKTSETESPYFVRAMRCSLVILFLIPAMASLALFNHVAMAYPAPMADDLLLRWDRALGLNWVAYAHLIGDVNIVSFILDHIYQAMLPALIIVGLHAVFIGHSSKCNELLALVITTGIFSVFIAAFFPAIGPMDYIHDTNVMALFAKNEISGFLPQLIELRTATHIALNPLRLAGLAQFPSYHCACGIYTIYGSRGSYYSLVPATIFSILMIAATPIIGDHYFVDLIAGACVAIAFILTGRKLYQNSAAKA